MFLCDLWLGRKSEGLCGIASCSSWLFMKLVAVVHVFGNRYMAIVRKPENYYSIISCFKMRATASCRCCCCCCCCGGGTVIRYQIKAWYLWKMQNQSRETEFMSTGVLVKSNILRWFSSSSHWPHLSDSISILSLSHHCVPFFSLSLTNKREFTFNRLAQKLILSRRFFLIKMLNNIATKS